MILIIHQQEQYSAAGKVGITFVPRVCSQIFSFSCCCEALTDLWPHYISDLLHIMDLLSNGTGLLFVPETKLNMDKQHFSFVLP